MKSQKTQRIIEHIQQRVDFKDSLKWFEWNQIVCVKKEKYLFEKNIEILSRVHWVNVWNDCDDEVSWQ